MAQSIPLPLQNVYVELVEQSTALEFAREFPSYGGFAAKNIGGNRYLYWQGQIGGRRGPRFVGLETPELVQRIARHKSVRSGDVEQRSRMVAALIKGGLRAPPPQAAKI